MTSGVVCLSLDSRNYKADESDDLSDFQYDWSIEYLRRISVYNDSKAER